MDRKMMAVVGSWMLAVVGCFGGLVFIKSGHQVAGFAIAASCLTVSLAAMLMKVWSNLKNESMALDAGMLLKEADCMIRDGTGAEVSGVLLAYTYAIGFGYGRGMGDFIVMYTDVKDVSVVGEVLYLTYYDDKLIRNVAFVMEDEGTARSMMLCVDQKGGVVSGKVR